MMVLAGRKKLPRTLPALKSPAPDALSTKPTRATDQREGKPETIYGLPERPEMGNKKLRGNVRRVSAKRPCRICGHPDWCLYTLDDEVSICARITDGATKVNERNEGVFVHRTRDFKAEPIERAKSAPATPLA